MEPSAQDILECVQRIVHMYSVSSTSWYNMDLKTLFTRHPDLLNWASELRPNDVASLSHDDMRDELGRIYDVLERALPGSVDYAECVATAFSKMRPIIRICTASVPDMQSPSVHTFDDMCFTVFAVMSSESMQAMTRAMPMFCNEWMPVRARILVIGRTFLHHENATERTWPNAIIAMRTMQTRMMDADPVVL